MDQDLKIIKEYLSKIPRVARDAILSDEWTNRITEISRKYSLNDDQTSNLNQESLLAAIGIEPEEDLRENLKNNMLISDLLAEQLSLDIEQRIFSWIDKVYEAKNKPEISNINPAPEKPRIEPVVSAPTPNYTPRPKVILNTEPVQSPVAVPRFKAVPLSDNEIGQDFIPNIAPKPSGVGIMETKINSVVEKTIDSAPRPTAPKYSVDPYREPLA